MYLKLHKIDKELYGIVISRVALFEDDGTYIRDAVLNQFLCDRLESVRIYVDDGSDEENLEDVERKTMRL